MFAPVCPNFEVNRSMMFGWVQRIAHTEKVVGVPVYGSSPN